MAVRITAADRSDSHLQQADQFEELLWVGGVHNASHFVDMPESAAFELALVDLIDFPLAVLAYTIMIY